MQVDSQLALSVPGAAAGRPGSPPGKAPRKTPSRPAKVAHQAGKLGCAHVCVCVCVCVCGLTLDPEFPLRHAAGVLSTALFVRLLPAPWVG